MTHVDTHVGHVQRQLNVFGGSYSCYGRTDGRKAILPGGSKVYEHAEKQTVLA